MNIEDQRSRAMNACISIHNDLTEEEVKKFMPESVQIAWSIGAEYLDHALKEQRNNRKKFTI